jgi:competence ComEA-like helix-hairpin-helix protein
MFYLTPQERKFICLVCLVFIVGAFVQLLFKRDIAPVRWFKHVREFKININTASAEQLQMLPGIGSKLSQNIVNYRREISSFRTLDQLEDVDGMTSKRFERIKGLIEL